MKKIESKKSRDTVPLSRPCSQKRQWRPTKLLQLYEHALARPGSSISTTTRPVSTNCMYCWTPHYWHHCLLEFLSSRLHLVAIVPLLLPLPSHSFFPLSACTSCTSCPMSLTSVCAASFMRLSLHQLSSLKCLHLFCRQYFGLISKITGHFQGDRRKKTLGSFRAFTKPVSDNFMYHEISRKPTQILRNCAEMNLSLQNFVNMVKKFVNYNY